MDHQLVVFELEHEHFGVSISAVESIIKMQPITKIPQAPAFIEGVTNLRGKILPVIDLRRRFGMPVKNLDHNGRIIVISTSETQIGMIVDAVSEVLTISPAAIEPVPAFTTQVDAGFITGIAKVEQRLIILLDLNFVLSAQENLALEMVTQ